MPVLGDIKNNNRSDNSNKLIWSACETCGKERWRALVNGKPKNTSCHRCSQIGSNNSRWTGGKQRHNKGYITVKLQPDDFFFSMTHQYGYVMEHRLVIAKHIGRCLHSWEIVHHRNGIKDDNRLENIQLVSELGHQQTIRFGMIVDKLKKEITALRLENSKLKRQLYD